MLLMFFLQALRRHIRLSEGGQQGQAPDQDSQAVAAMQVDADQQGQLCVTKADLATAAAKIRPSALRELAVEVPSVRWGDVGGLEEVKAR